jgi:fructose-1,6-bisphosphatase/inositol monophosphatase family enzyme
MPTFTTLIALLESGTPRLSVIDQPFTGERWSAVSNGAGIYQHQDAQPQALAVSNVTSLAQARLATTSPYLFTTPQRDAFERLREATPMHSFGGDAYHYALLASGQIDLVAEAGLKAHDLLPLLPVLHAASAVVTDWHGTPITACAPQASDLSLLASASPELHHAALRCLS